MSKYVRPFSLLLFLLAASLSHAQDMSNPGDYMSFINNKEREVTQTYLSYLSAVSHGKSARKVEKLREKVVNTIFNTRMEISGTPPFKGDRTLKDASVAHLKLVYSVFNEDYAKIVRGHVFVKEQQFFTGGHQGRVRIKGSGGIQHLQACIGIFEQCVPVLFHRVHVGCIHGVCQVGILLEALEKYEVHLIIVIHHAVRLLRLHTQLVF